jgi:hypothetical protein
LERGIMNDESGVLKSQGDILFGAKTATSVAVFVIFIFS